MIYTNIHFHRPTSRYQGCSLRKGISMPSADLGYSWFPITLFFATTLWRHIYFNTPRVVVRLWCGITSIIKKSNYGNPIQKSTYEQRHYHFMHYSQKSKCYSLKKEASRKINQILPFSFRLFYSCYSYSYYVTLVS